MLRSRSAQPAGQQAPAVPHHRRDRRGCRLRLRHVRAVRHHGQGLRRALRRASPPAPTSWSGPRPRTTRTSAPAEARAAPPTTLVDTVAAVPGVDVAEGSVTGFALILDKDGDPIQPGGAPTLGTSVGGDAAPGRRLHPPPGPDAAWPDEVAIDARTADRAGVRARRHRSTSCSTTARHPSPWSASSGSARPTASLGATLAGFDLATAQQVLGKAGTRRRDRGHGRGRRRRRASSAPGSPRPARRRRGADRRAGRREGAAAMQSDLAIFTTVLLVFAGVVAARRLLRHLEHLQRPGRPAPARGRRCCARSAPPADRCSAASWSRPPSSAWSPTAARPAARRRSGRRHPRACSRWSASRCRPPRRPSRPRTVVAALAVGVGVTVVAAAVPAWAATRVAPMEALRDAAPSPTTRKLPSARWSAGVVLSRRRPRPRGVRRRRRPALVDGAGDLTAFVGLVVVRALAGARPRPGSPTTAAAAAGGGWPHATSARSPRRAAATALALTIGLTVVSAVAVTATSLRESVGQTVSARQPVRPHPRAARGRRRDQPVRGRPRCGARTDVDDVVELKYSGAQVDGTRSTVVAVDPADLGRVIDLGIESRASRPAARHASRSPAPRRQALGVEVGDTVTVTFPETGATTYRHCGVRRHLRPG